MVEPSEPTRAILAEPMKPLAIDTAQQEPELEIDDAWLEAMLDARPHLHITSNSGAAPEAGIAKLSILQNAFSQLQWAELEVSAMAESSELFKWRHLVVLSQLDASVGLHAPVGLRARAGDAEVFRAYDPMLQREVALKLRPVQATNADRDLDAQFIAKASRLAQVRQSNMLAVHGAALDQGRAGFWMALIAGETLAERVARSGVLTPEVLLQLLTELAGALLALHANALAHGALRANNIRCEAGTLERFVLMDIAAHNDHSLASGDMPEMRQAASPADDIAALAAVLLFASGNKNVGPSTRLSKGLRVLLRAMQHPDPQQRPSAQKLLAAGHALIAEPERRMRQRLRTALTAALIGGVVASAFALLYALNMRSLAQVQRDQAQATQDFLLSVLRSPNPAQNLNAAKGVVQVFEQAVAAVPKAFSTDAKTAALLLVQFGRALQAAERHDTALAALAQADQLLAQAGTARSDASRIEAQAFMILGYRAQRQYAQSLTLANAQAALCTPPSAVSEKDCLGIFNDQILAQEPHAPLLTVLDLVAENLARADAAGLNFDARKANTLSMQGLFRRELGQARGALTSYLAVTEILLAAPSSEPGTGVLTALGSLALSADELADIELAEELNDAALAGFTALYGSDSRRTARLELQAAHLALHASDAAGARLRMRRLLALPDAPANTTWREQARVLSALANDAAISDVQLAQAEQSRQAALGEGARALAEFRLGLAAVALKRKNLTLAKQLLAKTKKLIDSDDGAGMRPLYWALALNLAQRSGPVDPAEASKLQAQIDALLAAQGRQLFDPVRGVWLGTQLPDAPARLAQIKAAAKQIYARSKVRTP